MSVIGALFFIFGFVTWLNGFLVPYLRIACELNNFQSFFVTFAFYISYVIMALPSAAILHRTGLRDGMMYGLFLMALGASLFIPAALTRYYLLFLLGLFVMGMGLAILQTASNPYITLLGSLESSARRISVMGICNKSAGIVATLLFGFIALQNADEIVARFALLPPVEKAAELDALAAKVIVPYIIITLTFAALGVVIRFARLPEPRTDDSSPAPVETALQNRTEPPASEKNSVFQFPYLIFGVIALFCDVGLEIVAGDSIISFGRSLGIPLSTARFFTAFTMVAMICGYSLWIYLIPRFMSQVTGLKGCAMLGIALTLAMFWIRSPAVAIVLVALMGFANSLIWPAVWPLAIKGLGRLTAMGSALLIIGNLGGAIVPLAFGSLLDYTEHHSLYPGYAYVVMLPCYVYIAFYAFWGHRITCWKRKSSGAKH